MIFVIFVIGVDISIDHNKLIQGSYTFLIENIDTNCGFLDQLFQSEVLSRTEMDEILVKETPQRRNQELLSIITRKSSSCFQHFLASLQKTNQGHVVEKLQPSG